MHPFATKSTTFTPTSAVTHSEDKPETKVVLLVRLLNAIDEGCLSLEQLKERISDSKPPSTRSMRRYLDALSAAGFPWFFDRTTSVYRFADGYSLRRLNLTPNELLGLITLKQLGSSLGGTLARYIDETTAKILSSSDRTTSTAIASTSLSVRLDAVTLTPDIEQVFEVLQRAERANHRIVFDYIDKKGTASSRRLDPYGFIVSTGRIYLVGFDHGRNDIRVFAVDNIGATQILPQTFTRPTDFNIDTYGANSVSGVWQTQNLTPVTVRFSALIAKAAAATNVAKEKAILTRADGSLDITYTVNDPLEIIRWSLGWGAEAEVLAPESARTMALQIAQNIVSRYT